MRPNQTELFKLFSLILEVGYLVIKYWFHFLELAYALFVFKMLGTKAFKNIFWMLTEKQPLSYLNLSQNNKEMKLGVDFHFSVSYLFTLVS